MTGRDVALLARTAVHLRPGQIAQRARLRTQRTALRRFPPAGRWLLRRPRSGDGGGLAGRIQPARRAAPAGPAWSSGPAGWPPRAAGDGPHPDPSGAPRSGARRDGGFPDAGPAPEHRAQTAWMQADWEQADAPAAMAVPPALLGLGMGAGREPDRAAARALFARFGDPGRRRHLRPRRLRGYPTRRRSAPGRGAEFTGTWSRAARSRTASSPACRFTPVSCGGIWSPMSAATT